MEQRIMVTFENPDDLDDNNIPSPYVHFGSVNEDLANQPNSSEIVILMTNIRVVFSFPLSRDVLVKFESSGPHGFTRDEIARKVYHQYCIFYAEETDGEEVDFEAMREFFLEERRWLQNGTLSDVAPYVFA